LDGVDAVIDVMNPGTLSARVATRFFTRSTARLLAAGEAAGVKHHVALSIVGIDGVEGGAYAGKLAHERAVDQSERVPYTVVGTRCVTRRTARVLAAGEAAGAKHHVALSIVGIDGVEGGYYAGKLAHERAVEQSERVPYTIVRAAQFHEFPAQFLARMPGPIA